MQNYRLWLLYLLHGIHRCDRMVDRFWHICGVHRNSICTGKLIGTNTSFRHMVCRVSRLRIRLYWLHGIHRCDRMVDRFWHICGVHWDSISTGKLIWINTSFRHVTNHRPLYLILCEALRWPTMPQGSNRPPYRAQLSPFHNQTWQWIVSWCVQHYWGLIDVLHTHVKHKFLLSIRCHVFIKGDKCDKIPVPSNEISP